MSRGSSPRRGADFSGLRGQKTSTVNLVTAGWEEEAAAGTTWISFLAYGKFAEGGDLGGLGVPTRVAAWDEKEDQRRDGAFEDAEGGSSW